MATYNQKVNAQAVESLLRTLDAKYVRPPEQVYDKSGKPVYGQDGKPALSPETRLFKQTTLDKDRKIKELGTIDKIKEELQKKPFDNAIEVSADGLKINFKVIERHTQRDKVSVKHLGLPKRWAADVEFQKESSRWIFSHGGKWQETTDVSEPIVADEEKALPHRDKTDIEKLEDGAEA